MSHRTCVNCGKSLDNTPYELWLFYTCRGCAAETHTRDWDERIGSERKWAYTPDWHFKQTTLPLLGGLSGGTVS